MERRKFIKSCCYSAIGISVAGVLLSSCESIYYATITRKSNRLVVSKKEFIKIKNEKQSERKFVLIKEDELKYPVCLYKVSDNNYSASLLLCTHNGCELNVGGGRYTCPCHGAEFSINGKVLQGPAEKDLKTYKTETDNENIYIHLS